MQQPNLPVTKRKPERSLHIDMTAMVDLGFLLITFFIFTTTISTKTSIALSVPKAGLPLKIPESRTMTFILARDNKVVAYEGMLERAKKNNSFVLTGYDIKSGIRKSVRKKYVMLESSGKGMGDEMIVLIKPLEQSSYANLVAVIDEMLINGIRKYAVVNASEDEKFLAGNLTGSVFNPHE